MGHGAWHHGAWHPALWLGMLAPVLAALFVVYLVATLWASRRSAREAPPRLQDRDADTP